MKQQHGVIYYFAVGYFVGGGTLVLMLMVLALFALFVH